MTEVTASTLYLKTASLAVSATI